MLKFDIWGIMMRKNDYLRHCAMISIQRRMVWIMTTIVLAMVVFLLANVSFTVAVAGSVLAGLVVALAIGINSWQRHAQDYNFGARNRTVTGK